MNKRIISMLEWLPVLILLWSVSCYCQTSTSYQLKNWSISNGGGTGTSASFSLKGATMGGLATKKSSSDSYSLNGNMIITNVNDSHFINFLIPYEFLLQQNYPNPFNPSTTIRYSLAKNSEVTIILFNSMGQVIRTLVQGNQQQGYYEVTWDGKTTQGYQAPSGVYYYQIIANGFTDVKKMLLIK